MLSPWSRRLVGALVLATLVLLTMLADLELGVQRHQGRARLPDEPYNLPPARLLRALSFGYNELAADFLWTRTISYFAEQHFQRRPSHHLDRYIDTILALDERFKAVYRYGSAMMLSRGDAAGRDDVLAAIDLAKRAHRLWPDDWRFPLNIGSYYMFELRTTDRARKEAWVRQGADWIRRAALTGADVPWLPSLAAKIYTKQGKRELAIRHLQELYLANEDQDVRRNILGKLRHLQAESLAAEVAEQAATFERAYRQSALSYVPADLWVLLRPTGDPAFAPDRLPEGDPTAAKRR